MDIFFALTFLAEMVAVAVITVVIALDPPTELLED